MMRKKQWTICSWIVKRKDVCTLMESFHLRKRLFRSCLLRSLAGDATCKKLLRVKYVCLGVTKKQTGDETNPWFLKRLGCLELCVEKAKLQSHTKKEQSTTSRATVYLCFIIVIPRWINNAPYFIAFFGTWNNVTRIKGLIILPVRQKVKDMKTS